LLPRQLFRVVHRPNCVKLNLDLENLDFASCFRDSLRWQMGLGGSMRRWLRRPVNPLVGGTARVVPHRKTPFLGLFAPLLVVIALPLFRTDIPSAAANSTLNCYDRAGNYESCETPAGAPPSQFNGRPTEAHQLASWT